eukprot:Lithocolla_globosa_v1_NODE_20_length_9637_cov_33.687643.p10 type:complete len:123 gc:universal NODE_20_length_9637_cov_33.687643:544-912(+)
MFEPLLCLKFEVKYYGVDKFSKHSFGLDEKTYNKLKDKLVEDQPNKFMIPLSTYEYNDKHYFNLKVKTTGVPQDFELLKGKKMIISCVFYKWEYMKNIGARAVVEDYEILEIEQEQHKFVSL